MLLVRQVRGYAQFVALILRSCVSMLTTGSINLQRGRMVFNHIAPFVTKIIEPLSNMLQLVG